MDLHQINATLGHFWQTTLKRGWPTRAQYLSTKHCNNNNKESEEPVLEGRVPLNNKQDKENYCPSHQKNRVVSNLKLKKDRGNQTRTHCNTPVRSKKPSTRTTTTDKCCLITYIWIVPQHRGKQWGLILANKASHVIPRRYNNNSHHNNKRKLVPQQALTTDTNLNLPHNHDGEFSGSSTTASDCSNGDSVHLHQPTTTPSTDNVQVVLALPPYNKRLQGYFGGNGTGWSSSWDPDFWVK